MSSTYAWIITHVNTSDLGDDCADEKGTMGPRSASDEMLAALKAGEGHVFRLVDDDGIWYYRGRIVFSKDGGPATCTPLKSRYTEFAVNGGLQKDDASDGDEFGPLEDWGTPNAGATEIHYRCDDPGGNVDGGKPVKVWAVL